MARGFLLFANSSKNYQSQIPVKKELLTCFIFFDVSLIYFRLILKKNRKMANKRTLKKSINSLVFDVIDECIYIQEVHPEKFEASEQLIDKAVNYYNDALAKMSASKTKADFRQVAADLDENAMAFVDELNSLNA